MAASAASSFALALKISAEPVRSAATAAARSLVCSSAQLGVNRVLGNQPVDPRVLLLGELPPGSEPLQIGFGHLFQRRPRLLAAPAPP